jgi:hypothetical protein
MNAGRFREDLYYRIAVLMVTVPPLAKRIDEVPVWARYMLRRCAAPEDTTAVDSAGDTWLEPEAAEVLQGQTWPGNLRQLDNVIRRAYAYCLLDRCQTAPRLTVTRAHIERAVAEDSAGQSSRSQEATLLRQIRAAARAYAREVKRRANTDAPLFLEWADAFRGFVLDSTVKRFGSKEAAFDALGLGSAVKDRNHHRIMKQQLKLVASFIEFLEKKTGAAPELPGEGLTRVPGPGRVRTQ